jgi:hypothetical protein
MTSITSKKGRLALFVMVKGRGVVDHAPAVYLNLYYSVAGGGFRNPLK